MKCLQCHARLQCASTSASRDIVVLSLDVITWHWCLFLASSINNTKKTSSSYRLSHSSTQTDATKNTKQRPSTKNIERETRTEVRHSAAKVLFIVAVMWSLSCQWSIMFFFLTAYFMKHHGRDEIIYCLSAGLWSSNEVRTSQSTLSGLSVDDCSASLDLSVFCC